MKKHAITVVLALSLLFLALPSHAAPVMELSAASWNMGAIFQWTNPFTQITIRNKGDQDLLINDIKSSCGCTAAIISDKVIKPGGEGTLRIEFSSSSYRGRIRRDVTLYTNDPAAAVKVIPISGYVKADKASVGTLEPEDLDVGVVAPYETRHFSFNIKNKGNVDLPIAGVELPPGCEPESASPAAIPASGMVQYKAAYRPVKDSGPIDEEVVVRLANDQRELRLRLVGYVAETGRATDAVIITPSLFRISPSSPSAGLQVGLKNEGDAPVLVDGAESSMDGLDAPGKAFEIAPGSSGSIKLSVDPGRLKPGRKGYLYIRIAVPVELETFQKK